MRDFYLTFGLQYPGDRLHPYWPAAHHAGYVLVQAPDEELARQLVRHYFGLTWAFLYEEARWKADGFPRGRLATLTLGGVVPAEGVEPPTLRFNTSMPEFYGVEDNKVICARIEGILKEHSNADSVEALGYEAEHVHLHCLREGRELFKEIHEEDTKVLAGELDWVHPYPCPVCEESIT